LTCFIDTRFGIVGHFYEMGHCPIPCNGAGWKTGGGIGGRFEGTSQQINIAMCPADKKA